MYEQLQRHLDLLKAMKIGYEAELAVAPEGRLIINAADNLTFYCQATHRPQGCVKRGITRNVELIQQLARKAYLEKALPEVVHNITVLDKAIRDYRSLDACSIVAQLPNSFHRIPDEYYLKSLGDEYHVELEQSVQTRIRKHAEWAHQDYRKSDYLAEERNVITSRGEQMRSKSEVMIAELLYSYDIPFRYEQVIELDDGSIAVPDFSFEGADGNEFYLEFCGMMDDPQYVAHHIRKLARYQNADIVPWKNIIYLYASANEMNMQRVDDLIRNQIIPWL